MGKKSLFVLSDHEIELKLDGHVSPQKLRSNPPPKRKVHWDDNDGRAPDTEDASLPSPPYPFGHSTLILLQACLTYSYPVLLPEFT